MNKQNYLKKENIINNYIDNLVYDNFNIEKEDLLKTIILSKGNSKIHENTAIFSLPTSCCLNNKDCSKTCYAVKAERIYKQVLKARNIKLKLAIEHPKLLKDLIIHEIEVIKASKKDINLRIHESGDFISKEYIEMWIDIIKTYNKIFFYGYSKTFDIFKYSLKEMNKLDNCNIINSILPNGEINYGTIEHFFELKEEYEDIVICPATLPHKKDVKICMNTCKMCLSKDIDKIYFKKH